MRFLRPVPRALAVAAFALGAPLVAGAQTTDTLSLQGKSYFAVGLGLTGARDASVAGFTESTHTTGQLASLSFTHFARPSLAIEISAAVLDADAVNVPGNQRANAITPILFGLSYSPRALAISTSLRPFVSIAAGPYIHSVEQVAGLTTSSSTETAAGARLGTGVNWFVSRYFMLQVEGDYHAVGRFEHQDALTQKPSGFGLSAGFGLGWGGR